MSRLRKRRRIKTRTGKIIGCSRCGKEFYQYPSGNRKFCSRTCYYPKQPIIQCLECHKPFRRSNDNRKFCSRKCYLKQHSKIEKTCLCGKVFVDYISSSKKFCSLKCGYKYRKIFKLPVIAKNCPQCGKSFFENNKSVKRFCSKTCHYKFRKGKSWEEFYGYEKSLKLKKKLAKTLKTGRFIKCEVCQKEFYISKKSRKRFCSYTCSRIGKNSHLNEVKQQAENLTNQGFRCIITDIGPKPDIIAVKNNKIFAVEVEFGEPITNKYETIFPYNDIWWFIIKHGKREKRIGNRT